VAAQAFAVYVVGQTFLSARCAKVARGRQECLPHPGEEGELADGIASRLSLLFLDKRLVVVGRVDAEGRFVDDAD
jgi:hypothetical protein